MKKLVLLGSVLAASVLCAQDEVAKLALDNGLAAIPSDAAKLEEMVKAATPDYDKYATTPERVELGKYLYFEPRISKSGIISCNTCHNLALGGTDGVPASTGHLWTPNPHHLNAPTTLNSVFNSKQFWDGRAAHLADQAQGPIQADPEMAASPELVEQRVNSMPGYVEMFKKAYGDDVKITFDLVASTIGVFERTLVTPSKFDKFLEGDDNALNADEKAGLKLFVEKGCTACHNGVVLGGTMQAFNVAKQYKFMDTGDFKGDENGMVKTPPLRNVELTAPYFHNGAIWDLDEAVKEMGSVQLGIEISDAEAASIVTFLKSLTGDLPAITYPAKFPASTKDTPKPALDYK